MSTAAAMKKQAMSKAGGSGAGDIDMGLAGLTQEAVSSAGSAPRSRWPHLLCSALETADYPLASLFRSPPGMPDVVGVDLTTLQRLNLYHLQHRLVTLVRDIITAQENTSEVPLTTINDVHEALKCYCKKHTSNFFPRHFARL
jgi:hypothetical protein